MKKYRCVYTDKKGRIYYKLTLGKDKIKNKPIQVKSYKDEYGKSFKTLEDAYATTLIVKANFIKTQKQSTDESQTFSNYIDKIYQPSFSKSLQDSTAYIA